MNRITIFRQQFTNNNAIKFIKEYVSEENRKNLSKCIVGSTALISIYNGLAVEYNISKNLPIIQPSFAEDSETIEYDRFLKNSLMTFVGTMYYITPLIAVINFASMTNIAGAGLGLIITRNINPLNFSNIKISYTDKK